MDCSICMSAIDDTTSSARTSCRHSFHFGCLATWSRKNTSCPLCRTTFTETDAPQQLLPGFRNYLEVPPIQLQFPNPDRVTQILGEEIRPMAEFLHDTSSPVWRRTMNALLRAKYRTTPLEEYDTVDVNFVAHYGCIPLGTAKAYLRYYNNDPIETLLFLMGNTETLPIPEFKQRDRPVAEEPYISRDIGHRVGTTALTCQSDHDGYESC